MKDMFKGNRVDNGEEVEGDLVHRGYDGIKIIKVGIKQFDYYPTEVHPESVKINLNGKWSLLSELDKPCEWNNLNHTTSCGNIYPHRITDFRLTCCTYCGKKIKEV